MTEFNGNRLNEVQEERSDEVEEAFMVRIGRPVMRNRFEV